MGKKLIIKNGDRYGKLKIVSEVIGFRAKSGELKRTFVVKCDCGKTKNVALTDLRSGKTKSCGCLMIATNSKPRKELKKKYNRLTLVKEIERTNPKYRKFLTLCDCGNYLEVELDRVTKGNTKSCGCLKKENSHNIIHGLTKTVEYNSWSSMKSRCYNKNNKCYQDYGGRGIKVCDRWLEPKGQGFLNFLSDMGKRPEVKYSLDRIDVNGMYCPENCRWADDLQQANNKRPMKTKPTGRTLTLIPEGTKISMLTVVKEIDRDKKNKRRFEVKCDCGKTTTIMYCNLFTKSIATKSCGCHRRKRRLVDIPLGKRYGRLVVQKLLETDLTIHYTKRRRLVEVKCDCGVVKNVRYHDLSNNKLVSCGCFKFDWFTSDDLDYKLNYRIVYEKHYGVKIAEGNQIHHIDADRLNNDASNLIEVTQEEHTWIHTRPDLIGISRDKLIEELNNWFRCVVI
jgi:hypothetical protein